MRTVEHKASYHEYYSLGEMTPERILSDSNRVQRTISECEELINWLKDYQLELHKKYNELVIAGYHTRLKLERRTDYYSKKVHYHLTIERVYESGVKELVSTDKYAGTERHKAIAKFNELCKQNPHWEAVKNIQT